MTAFLQTVQSVSGILLVVTILLQHRGTGLGGAFGGSDTAYRSRRGIEQLLFRATILVAAVFIISAIALLIIR